MKTLVVPIALFSLVLGAGCASGPSSRIAEKSAVYQSLTAEEQEKIKYGEIAEGFTIDMVYMALGKPSKMESAEQSGLRVESWTYDNFSPSLYGRPVKHKSSPGMPMSKGSNAWGPSQPSDLSAHGDMVNTPNSSSGAGGTAMPDVPTSALRILFHEGKVVAFKVEQ